MFPAVTCAIPGAKRLEQVEEIPKLRTCRHCRPKLCQPSKRSTIGRYAREYINIVDDVV